MGMEQIFPRVLGAFGNMFDSVLTEIHREFTNTGSASLHTGKLECVAHLEMLSSYAFTGEIRICPTKLWGHLGVSHSINYHGFPHINPQKLSLLTGFIHEVGWPKAAGKDLLPELTYIHALKFHYGASVAKAHHYWASFTQFAPARINSVDDLYNTIHTILETLMIPETREWLQINLLKACKQSRRNKLLVRGLSPEERNAILREFYECEEQLSDFGSANSPFCRGK